MTTKDAEKKANASGGSGADAGGKVSKSNAIKTGYGIVKSVSSGSNVIISGIATAGNVIPPEKVVILSGINAPKLQRAKAAEKDEV